jgi:membrane protease YdiL (CAAX protease family)
MLWQRLWRVSQPKARFWLYALSPLGFLAIALLIAKLAHRVPPLDDLYVFSGLPRLPLTVVLILVLLFNGYGEETGWRGFALLRLQERFGPIGGPIVLGLIWAGWHVPSFPVIEGYATMTLPVVIFGFGLGIICGSIVLADVFHRTGGSVLAVAVWHLLYNLTSATLGSRGIIGGVTTSCVEVWAIIIVWQQWPAHRAWRAAGREPLA